MWNIHKKTKEPCSIDLNFRLLHLSSVFSCTIPIYFFSTDPNTNHWQWNWGLITHTKGLSPAKRKIYKNFYRIKFHTLFILQNILLSLIGHIFLFFFLYFFHLICMLLAAMVVYSFVCNFWLWWWVVRDRVYSKYNNTVFWKYISYVRIIVFKLFYLYLPSC